MTDINIVSLIGRITRDLTERDFGYTSGGTARANISVACGRSVKKNDQWTDEVSYFDITIWGKNAENLKRYLTKGKQIAVQGYLKQERWKDKQTENNRSRVYIVADSVQLLGGKSDETESCGGSYKGGGTFQANDEKQEEPSMDGFTEF